MGNFLLSIQHMFQIWHSATFLSLIILGDEAGHVGEAGAYRYRHQISSDEKFVFT